MKITLFLLTIFLTACTPVQSPMKHETKYPDTPTMQSAEDATTGKLFED